MTKPKRRRPVGESIGGILAGFDQQVMRTTPPAQELVAKARPVRGVSGEDGSSFDIVFPDEVRDGEPVAGPAEAGGGSGGASSGGGGADAPGVAEVRDGRVGTAGERGPGR